MKKYVQNIIIQKRRSNFWTFERKGRLVKKKKFVATMSAFDWKERDVFFMNFYIAQFFGILVIIANEKQETNNIYVYTCKSFFCY